MAVVKLADARLCRSEDPESLASGDVEILLSADKGNESEVITGPDAGMTLNEYINRKGWGCLGTEARKYRHFPLSIQILSNNNPNMIQVNPDTRRDTFWYVLSAGEGSKIGFGMAEQISVNQLTAHIQDGTLGQYLRYVPVSKGDFFELEAGTVYAMTADVRILEVQKEGEKKDWSASDVISSIRLEPSTLVHPRGEWVQDGQARTIHLAANSVFDVDAVALNGRLDLDASDKSFYAMVFTDGSAVIDHGEEILHAEPENCFFVEAGTEPFHVTGNCDFLIVSLA